MQTTIKASQDSKRKLERLRAEIARHEGRRVSQRELVDHLIANASKDPVALAESLKGADRTMGPREFREFLKKRKGWGVTDASVGIDAWLYGGRS